MRNDIKKINEDYLSIINSQEYKIGKYIRFTLQGLLQGKLLDTIKHLRMLKKLKKTKGKKERYVELPFKDIRHKRIAIYTVLFGEYDCIRKIYMKPDNCDFFIITNQDKDTGDYQKIQLDKNNQNVISNMTDTEKNRYFKMLGISQFNEYDYTIYLDANLEIYGDLSNFINQINETTGIAMFNHSSRGCIYREIKACKLQKKGNYFSMKKQANHYKKNGFPKDFGMCECCVIVKDNSSKIANHLMTDWWSEFERANGNRDQIVWPYVLWMNGFKITDVGCLGENISLDGNFRRYKHEVNYGNNKTTN